MTNIAVVENKISAAKKYLKILADYRQYSKAEIENSVERRGAVERYLYLLTQTTIDLAETIISFKKLRKPTTLTESFYILEEEQIISAVLAAAMAKMVGFRNILSHEYAKINYEIVVDVLKNKMTDIEKFLEVAQKTT